LSNPDAYVHSIPILLLHSKLELLRAFRLYYPSRYWVLSASIYPAVDDSKGNLDFSLRGRQRNEIAESKEIRFQRATAIHILHKPYARKDFLHELQLYLKNQDVTGP